MKIAIDASQIIYGTGVSKYTQLLLENLVKFDKKNEYIIFGGSLRRFSELKYNLIKITNGNKNFNKLIYPFPPTIIDLVWNKLHKIKVESLIGDIDLFHSSDWTQPPTKAIKVTTVHDLMALKFSELLHPKIVEAQKRRLELVKKEADAIIVPSSQTKEDLVTYGIDGRKIKLIYEANSVKKASEKIVKKVKKGLKLKGAYLIALASAAYKNPDKVLKAFKKISKTKDITLVLIGRQSNTNIKPEKNVLLTGYVSDLEYSALLSGAEALIFPSIYEGFGMAVLDAFACETPVVTSNVSSLPEVAGNGAYLANPNDINSIAEGILEVLKNKEDYIEKGLTQLRRFSWERNAKETVKLYESLI